MTKVSALALISLTVSFTVLAQTNFATLSGRVTDQQERPVVQASVQLKSQATSAVRTASIGETGLFEIAGLAPGDYVLEISASGFASLRREVRLEVGQQMHLDIELTLGPERTTVDIVGRADVLKTTDTSLGEVIEPNSIRELPLNGRMLLDLALTVPGSHMSHGAQMGDASPLYWRPGQASAISVSGNRPNANYFLLDGATNTDPTFNTQNLSISQTPCRNSKWKPAATRRRWAARAADKSTS